MKSPPGGAMALLRGLLPAFAGAVAGLVLHLAVAPRIGPFWSKVLMTIGINVILAVSLTMVNGFTGQFSIGHAGFMAVGGYFAGAITFSIILFQTRSKVVSFVALLLAASVDYFVNVTVMVMVLRLSNSDTIRTALARLRVGAMRTACMTISFSPHTAASYTAH